VTWATDGVAIIRIGTPNEPLTSFGVPVDLIVAWDDYWLPEGEWASVQEVAPWLAGPADLTVPVYWHGKELNAMYLKRLSIQFPAAEINPGGIGSVFPVLFRERFANVTGMIMPR
jgi:hypothetical protein